MLINIIIYIKIIIIINSNNNNNNNIVIEYIYIIYIINTFPGGFRILVSLRRQKSIF